METNWKKSFFEKTPSWALSLLTLIITAIVLLASDALMTPHTQTGTISYVLNDILIASGCFLIIRQNPKSIWYVPLICNALLITSAFVEPTFWKTAMWIPICGGWALSLIVSIIGARVGRRLDK
jgi:hypothetical protein